MTVNEGRSAELLDGKLSATHPHALSFCVICQQEADFVGQAFYVSCLYEEAGLIWQKSFRNSPGVICDHRSFHSLRLRKTTSQPLPIGWQHNDGAGSVPVTDFQLVDLAQESNSIGEAIGGCVILKLPQ